MLQGKQIASAGTDAVLSACGLLDPVLGESGMFNLKNQPAYNTPRPCHWEDGNPPGPSVKKAGRKRVKGKGEGTLAEYVLPSRHCARCFTLAVTFHPHNNPMP